MKEIVSILYDYNYWATRRILASVAKVSKDQFNAPTPFSPGGLRGILVHTLSAEWVWRTRCQEGVSPPALLSEADFPTLSSLCERWGEEESNMCAYLASLSEADLSQTIEYKTTSGKSQAQPLIHILHHVVLHGMQHRAELAAILTTYNYSPGDIDFIVYLRGQGSS